MFSQTRGAREWLHLWSLTRNLRWRRDVGAMPMGSTRGDMSGLDVKLNCDARRCRCACDNVRALAEAGRSDATFDLFDLDRLWISL